MEQMRDVAATKEGTQSEDEQVPVRARTLPHINKMALNRSLFLILRFYIYELRKII